MLVFKITVVYLFVISSRLMTTWPELYTRFPSPHYLLPGESSTDTIYSFIQGKFLQLLIG